MGIYYENLRPEEFRKRLSAAPIAYLPLGTLEWHGEHLPLGTDMIIPRGFFSILAERIGGIVLPPLFIGPDRNTLIDGKEYIGMDTAATPAVQLDGSAYWIEDDLFKSLLHSILKQLKRAGFKVVVAHGHGPSTGIFMKNSQAWENEFSLRLLHCYGEGEGIQTDHAGKNETSLTMSFCPETVRIENLETDAFSKSMFNDNPPSTATPEHGKQVIDEQIKRMEALIREALASMPSPDHW